MCVLANPAGLCVGIEVKSGVGRLSEGQKAFKGVLEGVGARFIVARSVDDVAGLF